MKLTREMNLTAQNTLLMVTRRFPPITSVGIFRPLRFAKYLPNSNWSSVVLTGTPETSDRVDLELAQQIPKNCYVSRVPIRRPEEQLKSLFSRARPKAKHTEPNNTNTPATQHPSRSGRLRSQLIELAFAMPDTQIAWKKLAVPRGLQLINEHKIDAIFATAPPFSVLSVARTLAKRTGLPLIVDFRDPWTRTPWGPRNKSKVANNISLKLEQKAVDLAAKVILNTEHLKRDFEEHYSRVPSSKFICIPNGYDPELRVTVEELLCNTQTQRSKQFHLLHPGNLYRNRNPTSTIEAISILRKKGLDVHFEQLGGVENRNKVEQHIESLGLKENITLTSPVPHAEMLKRMVAADAFLLVQPGTHLQVPGKLFEMLLFRKPLVAAATDGALTEIIQNYNLGFTADAQSPEKIAEAIERATNNKEELKPNWATALQHFNGSVHAKQLANILDESIS